MGTFGPAFAPSFSSSSMYGLLSSDESAIHEAPILDLISCSELGIRGKMLEMDNCGEGNADISLAELELELEQELRLSTAFDCA